MRAIIVLLIFTLTLSAEAKIKNAQDFFKESQEHYQKALAEKTFEKKASIMKDLKKSFETTLKEYEKANPEEGDRQEHNVSLLFYTMAPAFELSSQKKVSKTECSQKTQSVRTQDLMGKSEDSKLSERANETIKWIEVLCK